MKTKHNPFLRLASLVAASAAFATSAHAADYYWTGSTSSAFNNAANWVGSSYAEWGDYHFDSNTTNGIVTLPGFVGISGLYLDSGLTTDITIGGGKIGMTPNNITQPAPYHADIVIDTASKNLTINSDETSYGATTWTVGANRTLILNGVLSNWVGQGVGSLVKTGTGTAVLANSNTYSGGTNVNQGMLVLAAGAWTLDNVSGGGVTVGSGATLRADNSVANQLNGLTLNGGTVDAINSSGNGDWGNFFLTGNVAASGNSALSADVALRATNVDFNVANGGTLNVGGKLHNGVYFAAQLSDNSASAGGTASTVSKSGDGIMVLSGNNSYTGPTTVSAGTLVVSGNTSTSSITVQAGGEFEFSGTSNYIGPINVNAGTLTLNNPVIDDVSPLVITSGSTVNLNFVGNDTVGSLDIDGSGPLPAGTYSATTGGYESYFTGTGSLVVAGASGTWTSLVDGNWSNAANWASNTVATGTDSTATFNAADDITPGVTVTLDTNRIIGNLAFDVSDYTIAGANTLTLDTDSTTPAISVDSGRTATISAGLVGTNGMEKTGAGTLVLTAANTYSGGTTVSAGTLILDGASGGTSRIVGDLIVNSGATVALTNGDPTGLGYNPGNKVTSLTIDGGTVTTGGVTHIWNFSGGVNMTGGTLQSNNGVSDANGSQMEWINADVFTNASANTATIAGRIRMRGDGGVTGINFTVADGAAATDLLVSAAVTEASAGLGITKNDSGTMALSGINTYTGNTTINEGTLVLADDAQLTFAVSNSSQNIVGGAGTATFRGDFSINTSAVTGTTGGIWLLVDRNSLTGESFESTFNVIGFTQQGDGVTWTMSDAKGDWTFSEGSGELTLVVSSDYEDWEVANGVTGGETDDDDTDGLTNFEEYAFGLDPTGGSSVNPITVQLNKAAKTFSYQRRDNGLTGLTYTVWFSTDLAIWTQDTGASQPDGTPDGNGVETINVTLSTLPGDPLPAKLFIQVRAE